MEDFHTKEKELGEKLLTCLEKEEAVLQQKSRDFGISLGDSNTKYFYNSMRIRQNKNSIITTKGDDGSLILGSWLEKEAIDFFSSLLSPVWKTGLYRRYGCEIRFHKHLTIY